MIVNNFSPIPFSSNAPATGSAASVTITAPANNPLLIVGVDASIGAGATAQGPLIVTIGGTAVATLAAPVNGGDIYQKENMNYYVPANTSVIITFSGAVAAGVQTVIAVWTQNY